MVKFQFLPSSNFGQYQEEENGFKVSSFDIFSLNKDAFYLNIGKLYFLVLFASFKNVEKFRKSLE